MTLNSGENTKRPIIAFDFDGTLTVSTNNYPGFGEPRNFAAEVTQFLYDIGVIIAIWTCRDKSQDISIYHHTHEKNNYRDDIKPLREYLTRNDIRYHTVNSIIKYAPFRYYESRKIYAHMYVDDLAFGWYDHEDVLIEVLRSFLIRVLGVDEVTADVVVTDIENGEEVSEIVKQKITDIVHGWGM